MALRRKWQKDEVDPVKDWVKKRLEEALGGEVSNGRLMAAAKADGVTVKRMQSLTPIIKDLFPMVELRHISEDGKSVRGIVGIQFKRPKPDKPILT